MDRSQVHLGFWGATPAARAFRCHSLTTSQDGKSKRFEVSGKTTDPQQKQPLAVAQSSTSISRQLLD